MVALRVVEPQRSGGDPLPEQNVRLSRLIVTMSSSTAVPQMPTVSSLYIGASARIQDVNSSNRAEKSGESSFGYPDLVKAKRKGWDGIRKHQARNFLRDMRTGDQAIFYRWNATPPGVVGICKIVKEAEPNPKQFDPTSKDFDPASKPEDPRWDRVTVAPVKALRLIPLDELRDIPELAECCPLARGNRLSVIPLTDLEFDAIVSRGPGR